MPGEPPRLRLKDCAGLFLLAAVVRCAFAFVSFGQFESVDAVSHLTRDTEHYVEAAGAIQSHLTLRSTGVRLFGPGYPLFLAALQWITGGGSVAALCLQLLVSSAGAVLIALLAFHITCDRRVAFLAGLLHALSLSALGHASAYLGEAPGLVLLCLGLLLFCRAIVASRLFVAACAGIVLGLSILTSVFVTPLFGALPVLALARPDQPGETWRQTLRSRWRTLGVALVSMLFLPALWIAHNRAAYGVTYLRQIEAVNMIRSASAFRLYQDGTPFETSMAVAGDSIQSLSKQLGNEHRAFECVAFRTLRETLKREPLTCLVVYAGTVDDNVNTDDGVWQSQFPKWKDAITVWKTLSERYLLRFRMLLLALVGAWVLFRRNHRRAFWVLVGLFVIFAGSAGASPWQGNRLFYSGQIAGSTLIAVALLAGWDGLREAARPGFMRRQSYPGGEYPESTCPNLSPELR